MLVGGNSLKAQLDELVAQVILLWVPHSWLGCWGLLTIFVSDLWLGFECLGFLSDANPRCLGTQLGNLRMRADFVFCVSGQLALVEVQFVSHLLPVLPLQSLCLLTSLTHLAVPGWVGRSHSSLASVPLLTHNAVPECVS